ncbi:GMC family oxidoreductase [Noviherbaspirillum sp. Root189]|uniref:GMC family oxidoreductase n=1 Tax=Noviherbaspirillum sp. Root189 TaxID=1736487 RepID=UPI00070F92EF|nr:GMC family oxidoreductase [Noviherbaspirillum sp. Root189]KRB84590.1 GMC family oxidoreductase [Noviherbaspirillum sp. Root189]
MTSNVSSPVIPDPIQAGLAAGWNVIDASTLTADRTFDADVAIVGTGAGGGVTAEILTLAGLKVVLIEEGPLKSSRDFKMREADAYPTLYQESAARKTKDKAINILQGRSVGGSTTVNWTSSFRTPPATLAYWQKTFGLHAYSAEALAPWFAMMERRLHIGTWTAPPNENNDLLRRGAVQLGIPVGAILRNVKGCWNLGYCGMGCPTNAKQSMLVTTIPSALSHGATLLARTRADRLQFSGDKVSGLSCVAMDASGLAATGRTIQVRAKHYVVAGGAINSPALLMRSKAPDPNGLLGKRTFLHPTLISAALHDHQVDGFAGAPQTIYSDHFLETQPIDGPIGYKLEAPPLHPLLFASTMSGFGKQHAAMMKEFARTHALLALLRDGFHTDSPGGSIALRNDGSPVLDYPISDFVWDGVRRAMLSMAEIQFAAGARTVYPVHEQAEGYSSWSSARKAIQDLAYTPLKTRVASAHVMGGCIMSDDRKLGIVSSEGRYHNVANLSVHDGSLFPTSIGANPQLSIYGITAKLASGLATELTGKPASPLPTL